MPLQAIPLFPLPTVLYPGAYLPLQIFEPRYRRMVKECLQNNSGFIIVQTLETPAPDQAQFYMLGGYGEIFDWHPLPNEMIGIELKGLRKARIHRHAVAPDGLIIGEVELLPLECVTSLAPRYDELAGLLRDIQAHPLITALPFDIDYDDATDVSFRLAESLPFTREEKQLMLEMDNAEARLAKVLSVLQELS